MDAVTERLRTLEDYWHIVALKTSYAELWNFGWGQPHDRAEQLAQLFVPDGVIDFGAFGLASGQAEIVEMAKSWASPPGTDEQAPSAPEAGLSVHYAANPAITVSGDDATASFAGMIMATLPGQTAAWVAGRYDDTLVRTESGWRFQRVGFTYALVTPFTGPGWVAQRMPALTAD